MKVHWVDNDYSSNGVHNIPWLSELSLIITFSSSKMWIGEIIHENNKIKVAPVKHHDLDKAKELLEQQLRKVINYIIDELSTFIQKPL